MVDPQMSLVGLVPSTVDPQIAFENAIDAGVLSADPKAPNYAGNYMFMGETRRGELAFKHRDTREYLTFEGA